MKKKEAISYTSMKVKVIRMKGPLRLSSSSKYNFPSRTGVKKRNLIASVISVILGTHFFTTEIKKRLNYKCS